MHLRNEHIKMSKANKGLIKIIMIPSLSILLKSSRFALPTVKVQSLFQRVTSVALCTVELFSLTTLKWIHIPYPISWPADMVLSIHLCLSQEAAPKWLWFYWMEPVLPMSINKTIFNCFCFNWHYITQRQWTQITVGCHIGFENTFYKIPSE